MKIKQYTILIAVLMVIFSCSNDDLSTTDIYPVSISIVHEDGSEISTTDCVNPDGKYAVKIKTASNPNAKHGALTLYYSVNGTLYSMTFLKSGEQINPITLIEGNNTAQITGSVYNCSFKYITQGDFELVE